jgi:uncharacterized repeat protein (TIGR01451 family)
MHTHTSFKTTRRYPIAIGLLALLVLVLGPHQAAFGQDSPSSQLAGNARGNSPFANDDQTNEQITVTGVLTIIHGDDFANKRSRNFYHLKNQETGATFNLRFQKKVPPGLRSGSIVKVRGRAAGREIYLALDEAGGESIDVMSPSIEAVSGEQRTLVIAANFLDASLSCYADDIQDLMFTDPTDSSIDDFYQETSSGNIWFNGDVAGPYTIDFMSTDTCNIGAWADAADAAALADGVDPGAYIRKVYVLPSTNGCGSYTGIGQVGGSPTRAWIFACDIEDIYAHELGHNLGMHHASTLNSEYGDTTDVMGAGNNGLRHINAAHQNEMGWRSPDMNILITESGTYDISPQSLYESEAPAPQILRISKPDTNEYYFIAFRRPVGFDANLQWWHHDMVTVHRYKGDDGPPTNTYLLDELAIGDSFIDSINDITIRHIGQTSDYATVQIDLNGDTACTTGLPAVSLDPDSQIAAPGETVSYVVSVTNNDGLNCAASSFVLNESIPEGWSGALSAAAMNLVPGQTETATLTITSANNAAATTYGLSVRVDDATYPEHTASANASYVVETACTPSIPLVGISPASQSAVAGTTLDYMVMVTNTDSDGCEESSFALEATVPAGWTNSISPDILNLSPGQSVSANLLVTSPDGLAAANYGFSVNVSDVTDPAHSASINASYAVEGVDEADTEAPSVPSGLTADKKGKNIKLSWDVSTDNVGVSGYAIWRNGSRIGDATDTAYVDGTAPIGTALSYTVSAYDAAGNMSSHSSAVTLDVSEKTNQGKPPKK